MTTTRQPLQKFRLASLCTEVRYLSAQPRGDRAYRYLHLDTGQLGEHFNVGAVRLGLGASGIPGYFDDQVNDLLGIPEREAVVYLTTLGVPEAE